MVVTQQVSEKGRERERERRKIELPAVKRAISLSSGGVCGAGGSSSFYFCYHSFIYPVYRKCVH